MSIFDTGNWELVTLVKNGRMPARGSIHLTISKKLIKLSPEAVKVMGSPTQVDIWTNEGRILFINNKRKGGRRPKDGSLCFHKPGLISEVMERLILYGSVEEHIGSDDKPLPGAYFCVEGKEFKERDPKDRRKWLHGVEFDLANAYYCQMSMDAVAKAMEARKKTKTLKQKNDQSTGRNPGQV